MHSVWTFFLTSQNEYDAYPSWDEAQKEYDIYQDTVLTAMTGSEVSKSGFF